MQFVDEKINNYCIDKSTGTSQNAKDLFDYTKNNVPLSQMLIGPLEGSLLSFLMRSIKAKNILELGTYTGYSSLVMAENLDEDGMLTTVDINSESVEVAKKFWSQSNAGKKIKSVLMNAVDFVKNNDDKYDFIFIDADKGNYLFYVQNLLPSLNDRGIIVVDNVLWSGKVFDKNKDKETEGIISLNNWANQQEDLFVSMLPVRDGMLLLQKK